jgi:D-sedoheptulose 7-phosphate isomerase
MRKRKGLPGESRERAEAAAEIDAYLARLRSCLRHTDPGQIAAVAERLWEVARAGGQVLIAGNGGSAASASHMALDLGKSTLGRPPRRHGVRVRTLALNDPGPMITAWGNDYGYERIFAEQIRTHGRPGDAAVLFSVSGNSPNIVAAAETAKAMGLTVIALLGRPGGRVRELADAAMIVPSEDYGIVEDVHLAINHAVSRYVMNAAAAGPPAGRDVDLTRRPAVHAGTPPARAASRRRG